MRAKVRGSHEGQGERDVNARRRAAMFWMLREAGASYGEIARGRRALPQSRPPNLPELRVPALPSVRVRRWQGAVHGALPRQAPALGEFGSGLRPGLLGLSRPGDRDQGHRDGNRNTNLHGHLLPDLILASVPPTAGAPVCAERSSRSALRRTRNPVKGVAAGPLHGHKAIHEPRRTG